MIQTEFSCRCLCKIALLHLCPLSYRIQQASCRSSTGVPSFLTSVNPLYVSYHVARSIFPATCLCLYYFYMYVGVIYLFIYFR